MKKLLWFIPLIIFMCSCETKKEDVETEKNDYLVLKADLQEQEEYTKQEELMCDITFSVDRTSEEEVSYRAIIDNPKEDMYNIKALLIHNYFTEDIFPSIGIFDETATLIAGGEEVRGISLVGYIETSKDIEELDLEMKVLIQYEDKDGKEKTIYYKATN